MRVLLCFFVLTLGGAAFAADWVDLLRDGQHRELELQGERAGASGVAAKLATGERARTLAALRASEGAADSWALLDDLAMTAAGADRSLAIEAAQVAAEVSHHLDAITIEEQEIPSEDLLQWRGAWLKVAGSEQRWVDIRVYALEVAAVLHELLEVSRRPELPWKKFIEDSDEEMRAAAIQLAPRTASLLEAATKLVADDKFDLVALSAAQRLCAPLGSVGIPVSDMSSAAIMKRLQELASSNALAFSSRVDLANCLARDSSEESRAALRGLVQESPPALRKALVALLQPAAP
jgi:hypothetical protein